jgi:hypothetical protein
MISNVVMINAAPMAFERMEQAPIDRPGHEGEDAGPSHWRQEGLHDPIAQPHHDTEQYHGKDLTIVHG